MRQYYLILIGSSLPERGIKIDQNKKITFSNYRNLNSTLNPPHSLTSHLHTDLSIDMYAFATLA